MTAEIRATRRELSVRTIPDPVDVSLFSPRGRAECRRRMFQTNSDEPWILFTSLSRSNPVKRVELAVEAVRRARRRMPGLELKVASGIAHSQMPYFVSACDVVLCTSTHEGWPNSVKEGLACGLPFVSTDVSDLRQVAERNESCRIVSDDPDDIAEGLLHAVRFPRAPELRGEAASMSVEASSRRILELYQSLLQAPRN
jgi:glycosyltransferase involved in cell wall biosynthesis